VKGRFLKGKVLLFNKFVLANLDPRNLNSCQSLESPSFGP